jgi:hypothetical protein
MVADIITRVDNYAIAPEKNSSPGTELRSCDSGIAKFVKS